MEKVYKFLKEAGTYYIATCDKDQPRVRPFGTVNIFEGRLYIQSGKIKPFAKQVKDNPKCEICAFKEGEWIRVEAVLEEDERTEAKKSMLDAYPELRSMYDENDSNTVVYSLRDATAVISSFTKEAEVIKF